jgi:hypothetical protein
MIDGPAPIGEQIPPAEVPPLVPDAQRVGHAARSSPLLVAAAAPAAPVTPVIAPTGPVAAPRITHLWAGVTDARGHVLRQRSRMVFTRTHGPLAHVYTLQGTTRSGVPLKLELVLRRDDPGALVLAGHTYRMNAAQRDSFRAACREFVGGGEAGEWIYRMVEHTLGCMRESEVTAAQTNSALLALTQEELVAITCWPRNGIWLLLQQAFASPESQRPEDPALAYARALVSALNALPTPFEYRCEV